MIDNFFNSKGNLDINFSSYISPLDTKYFNTNKIREGFECLCKNGFSVLHISIRSINKDYETFKSLYSKLNCTFSVVCFFKPWLLIIQFVMIQIFERENYTALHLERKSGRGGELSIFVREEIYFKHRTDLSINSNDVESLCIEIHQEKGENILVSVMCRPTNRDMTVIEMLCEIFPQMIKHQKSIMNLIRTCNTS